MIADNYLSYKPAGYSYRVDDHIFAGGYPVTEWDEGVRRSQVRQYTDFGITDFVDLTEAGREMPPYNMFLPEGIRDAAVAKMQRRYATNPNSRWYRSPENDAQVSFVRTYHEYITGNRM